MRRRSAFPVSDGDHQPLPDDARPGPGRGRHRLVGSRASSSGSATARQGVTHALLAHAVIVARDSGAVAIEGWPLAGSERNKADGYLGRESLFLDAGFSEIARPSERRVVMRYDLVTGTSTAGGGTR